jgi:hypothetical protein
MARACLTVRSGDKLMQDAALGGEMSGLTAYLQRRKLFFQGAST